MHWLCTYSKTAVASGVLVFVIARRIVLLLPTCPGGRFPPIPRSPPLLPATAVLEPKEGGGDQQ
jgi:hypothetical protein